MSSNELTVEQVMDALKNCYDPEIPINIVDLGLIYDVKIENGGVVKVKMTLTAQGCPAHGMISQDVKQQILKLSGVKDAVVEVVWDPPWSPGRMSDFAKRQLGIGGAPKVQVSPDSKPAKKGRLQDQPDGTKVLVSDGNMTYKVSPEVITFWNMCDGSKDMDTLAKDLAAQLNINEEIKPQILELVQKLTEAELLSA
ncbi:MAG: PqqD family peptide modification chaperone [Candidatus Bathyarchaeia archaeon]